MVLLAALSQAGQEPPEARLPGSAPAMGATREALELVATDADDWRAETLADQGKASLLALLAAADGMGSAPDWDPELEASELLPAEPLSEQRGVWQLLSGAAASEEERVSRTPEEVLGLVRAWDAVLGEGQRRTHLHVQDVQLGDGWFSLLVHVQRSCGARGLHGHWRVKFRVGEDEVARLWHLERESFSASIGAQPLFQDATQAVFGGDVLRDQLDLGIDGWRRRLDPSLGVGLLGHHGLAVGDLNEDGLEDLYLCQPGGLPNRAYLRQPDGSVREGASAMGINILDSCTSALIVDFDGDGDRELVLTTVDEVILMENTGRGRFRIAGRYEAPSGTSMAAADVDNDGDVDLFVCGYLSPYDGGARPVPYHDAQNGQGNLFLLNLGQLLFRDATAELGLDAEGNRFSFAAAFEDFDGDGDQDLYVANDFGRNALYVNADGRFTEAAAAHGVEDISAGMGVTWADFDGDGVEDLYVSNMQSSAGARITQQARFQPGGDENVRAQFRRHARGNSLFLGQVNASFEDASVGSGASDGGWAWGALAVDLNLDCLPDLVVPNGFVSGAAGGPDL
ncbi:MAG: hypothetical protein ACI8QC_001639 [Planctomycetota bacterium]|jgi:hypothetical protein